LIVDSSDDLLAISKTARQIERIVDEEADTVEYDLRELTERTIDSLNEEYPDGSVEFVANGSHRVHCIVGFEAALRNLLEHALTPGRSADSHARQNAEGGTSSDSSVVTASETDGTPRGSESPPQSRADPEATPASLSSIDSGSATVPGRTDGTGSSVRVELDAEEARPRITVRDDGTGIDAEELGVLAESDGTELFHGSDIELWLVRWVVDRSTAELSCETGPGGTEVTIRFQESAVARLTANAASDRPPTDPT
jgi:signal transduction histidine kinase